jgi:hypothetical protein
MFEGSDVLNAKRVFTRGRDMICPEIIVGSGVAKARSRDGTFITTGEFDNEYVF